LAITTTQLFEFLDAQGSLAIEKYEMHSPVFSELRRSIRRIVQELRESDEADVQEVVDGLRAHLSEWLTVPVAFDNTLIESISALGDPGTVETRWGHDVRTAYDLARKAAQIIQHTENPARAELRVIIRQLKGAGRQWRIYCHRRAQVHFQSLFECELLPADSFLHSVTDYREAQPFEVLVKVGPLRSRGWGSAPDAILNAPRFNTLILIVWSGCDDEAEFGYDPVASRGEAQAESDEVSVAIGQGHERLRWKRHIVQAGDLSSNLRESDSDDLSLFRDYTRGTDLRRATLVQIDDQDGIMYPPHSQVPTFDPSPQAEPPIEHKRPGETLAEGMFLIWPLLNSADLGTLQAGEGHYGRIWKERLRDRFRHIPSDLLHRLRQGGVDLRNLRSCVRQWCRPPSTVIHAPQQRRHFETMISVLGIDRDFPPNERQRQPWWEYAWAEIGQTRGEAIQTGKQENEIIDEQLFEILTDLLPEIQGRASIEDVFQVRIPPERSLPGAVRFYKVRAIEEGFAVPDTILKIICSLDTVDQWRV
jgi:hypothetical protein